MELNPQIIKKGSANEFVVLPYSQFIKMKELIEDYEDLQQLRIAKQEDLGKIGKSAQELLDELLDELLSKQ
jgi:hypothetical protein